MRDGYTLDKWERVIRRQGRLTRDQLIEAGRFGASAGWPGFTYTRDIVSFARRHAPAIWDRLAEEARGCGYRSPAEVLGTFTGGCDLSSWDGLLNAMAWYILEDTGQRLAGE